MKKLIITLLIVAIATLTVISPLSASAESVTDINTNTEANENVAYGTNNFNYSTTNDSDGGMTAQSTSTNLIFGVYLELLRDGNNLTILAQTIGYDTYSQVGFTNLKIQRLVNGVWTDVFVWHDMYAYNTMFHTVELTDHLSSGYSYRATCVHYIWNNGFLIFNQSQSINNQTTSLYIA